MAHPDHSPLHVPRIRACVLVAKDLQVVNFSPSGVAVFTDKPLVMGETYHLQLHGRGQSLIMEGLVARCNLEELSETADGHTSPRYLNGIQFQLSRNPLELALIDLLFENSLGEKRRGGQRVRPLQPMTLDIGRPCFPRVRQVDSKGILLESLALIDLDLPWNLLLQTGAEGMTLPARVLHASKKEGAIAFTIQLEFLNLDPEQRAFLDKIIQDLAPVR